jgi:hypothetical protein
MTNHVTLGADPEFFLRDTRTGRVTPAVGLIGGTKGKPVPIPGADKGFTMQEDNVMVEFNIPPCVDPYVFSDYINHALVRLDAHILDVSDGLLERDVRASRLFAERHLATPQARMFGCSPDFDGYRGGVAFSPVDMSLIVEGTKEWRFAGGHVHVGYNKVIPYEIPHFVVAQFMDLAVGVPMLSIEKQQGKRAELYGLPGRYRPTSYGIEYRSLSNLWVHDDQLALSVAQNTLALMTGLANCTEAQVLAVYGQLPWPSLREALLSKDLSQAMAVRRYLSSNFKDCPLAGYL